MRDQEKQLLEWHVARELPNMVVLTHHHSDWQPPQTGGKTFTLTGHFNSMAEVEQCLADPCTVSRSELMSR